MMPANTQFPTLSVPQHRALTGIASRTAQNTSASSIGAPTANGLTPIPMTRSVREESKAILGSLGNSIRALISKPTDMALTRTSAPSKVGDVQGAPQKSAISRLFTKIVDAIKTMFGYPTNVSKYPELPAPNVKPQGPPSGDSLIPKMDALAALVTDNASSKDIKASAKDFMATVQQYPVGDGDTAGSSNKSEATRLVQNIVLNSVIENLEKASTKTEISDLKTTLDTFYSPNGLAHELKSDFGIGSDPIKIVAQQAVDTFCKAFSDNTHIASLSIGEIRQAKETMPAFLNKIGASPSQVKTILQNLENMDHFATHFDHRPEGTPGSGDGAKFEKLSPKNREKLLQLYQNDGLKKEDAATSSFLGKLASTFEGDPNGIIDGMTAGIQSTTPGKQSQTQYQFLRFVSDFGGLEGKGNSHFDDVIVRLGTASEKISTNGEPVKTGFTVAQHKLHNALSGFSEKMNELNPRLKLPSGASMGRLRFDENTVKAIAGAAGGVGNVNMLLARVIDLQDKIQSRGELTGPPSDATKETFTLCGLVPTGQTSEEFATSLKIGGVNSSSEMQIFLSTLGDLAKELATNSALQGNISSLAGDPKELLAAFGEKLNVSKSEINAQQTVKEKVVGHVGDTLSNANQTITFGLKSAVRLMQGLDAKNIGTYQAETKGLYDTQSKLKATIDAAVKDSEGTAEKSGSVAAREIQLQDKGVPGFPTGRGASASMEWHLKGDGFPLGATEVTSGGKKETVSVNAKHLQLWQNRQMLTTEKSGLKDLPTGTQFETNASDSVTAALAQKTTFIEGAPANILKGSKSDGNSFSKHDLMPSVVKSYVPEGTQSTKVGCFALQRGADGQISEKHIGDLTNAQVTQYKTDLVSKDKSSSKTVDSLSLTITSQPNNIVLNKYLDRTQLGEVTSEHLQLAQNKQIISDEKTVLTGTGLTFKAGDADPKVTDALASKVEFLESGNASGKSTLTPGIVKKSDDGKLMYFEIQREVGGVIKETPVGQLTSGQAKNYLNDLKTKDESKSDTADRLAAKYPGEKFNAPELHSYLGLTQLAGNKDKLATVSTTLAHKKEMFGNMVSKDSMDQVKGAIVTVIKDEINKGGSFDAITGDDSKLAKTVIDGLNATAAKDGSPPVGKDVETMVQYAAQEVKGDGIAALGGWVKGINLSEAGAKHLEETSFASSFAGTQKMMEGAIGKLDKPTDQISIGWGTLVNVDLGVVTTALSPVEITVGVSASKSNDINISKGDDGKINITLNSTVGAGADIGLGFLSTLSATFGVNASSTGSLTCTFESPEKASGFMAALRTGKPELAIFHAESINAGDGKTISVNAQLSGEFAIPVNEALGAQITPEFNISVSGTLSKHTTPISLANNERAIETTTSTTREYSHKATIGVAIGDLSATAASDSRSFKTESIQTVLVNPSTNTLRSHVTSQVLQLDINGTTFTDKKNAINIGEKRLGQIVHLPTLESKFPVEAGILRGLLTQFDPMSQKINVSEKLSDKAVVAFNNAKANPEEQGKILKNPKNFEMTISIIDTQSDSSEQTVSVGVASATMSSSVSQASSKSVSFASSFSISRGVTSDLTAG